MLALDVYENFLKGRRRSQAVAGGRRRWAPPCRAQAEKGYPGATCRSELFILLTDHGHHEG